MRGLIAVLLVVGVAGCGNTDRPANASPAEGASLGQEKDQADRDRLLRLEQRAAELRTSLTKLQRELGVPDDVRDQIARGERPVGGGRHHLDYVARDEHYRELYYQLVSATEDHDTILDRHTDWNVRRLGRVSDE